MKLIECYIENFGKISKKKFSFTDGLNCINEDNGSGKSTLAGLIKVMLYGMSESKKQSLDENERKHFLPWQGGTCGGWITFKSGERIYRVERSFGAKPSDDTLAIYDTATGKTVNDIESTVGEWLFGIDAEGFERTVFLSERALTTKSDNKSISAKLSNLVGCDGDIGGMDEAMKLLEEQRKFYYKKGGSGEISDTKLKIDEINRKLERLEHTESALMNTRAEMTDLAKRINEAQEEGSRLMKGREAASVRLAENNHQKQSTTLRGEIEKLNAKRADVSAIFKDAIPDFSDIDQAAYKSNEAKNLTLSANEVMENPKFTSLANKFDGKLSREMVEDAKHSIAGLKSNESRKTDPNLIRAAKIFKGRIPGEDEIDEIERNLANGKSRINPIIPALWVIGAALLAIGVILPLTLLCILGVGVFALAIAWITADLTKQKKKRLDKISDFFMQVSGVSITDTEEMSARLRDMRRFLPYAKDCLSSQSDEKHLLLLKEFVALFPDEDANNPLASAEKIIADYEKYTEMAVAERYIKTDATARIQRAEMLREEVRAFLSSFNTKTSDPFSELRTALNEYTRLSADITAKRSELARLESLNSIGEGGQKQTESEIREIDAKRRENDELLARLNREYTLAERTLRNYSDELDGRHDLLMQRDELLERHAKLNDNYETILLTKKYITIAKDNITAKYLGKTKAGFLKYAEIIGGISGESFEMSTEFGVTKQEGTTTRPPEAYSRGTRDLFNLASRFALVDSLYEMESPFIILDDPFTALDDGKIKASLALLREIAKERQIIYFTCSKSRSI